MRWRSIILLALLVSEGSFATASDAQPQPLNEGMQTMRRVIVVDVPDPIAPAPPVAADDAPRTTVQWTVTEAMPVAALAKQWGLAETSLREMNPTLPSVAQPGTRLVVFQEDPEAPTESVGSPNRGRLRHGMPMPEGPYWRLRDRRIRAYGTEGTVRSLVTAFNAYGAAHPDGPPIHIGELSSRRGGRAWPHVSHRSGRDVDIGYVMKPGTLGERHWRRADETTLDVEKTWTLVKAIGDTGRVQRIFMSSKLQRIIKAYAKTVDSEETVAQYFRTPGAGPRQRYLITHENGHRDHMHVRFRCDPEDRRCRGHGLFPIEPPPPVAPPVRPTNANP
ncbi:MAG: penicillin-insensitive murein endopeptidase [Myxococcota bacterium]